MTSRGFSEVLHVADGVKILSGVNGDAPQNINVGIAGSITMILLCLGVAGLCISFYRRYKRAQGDEFDLGNQEQREASNPITEERATDNE